MVLRPTKRFSIAIIVVALVAVAFGMSGCSQLSKAESMINKKFSALLPDLTLRYNKLQATVTLAEQVGGKRDVITDTQKQLDKFFNASKEKDVEAQLASAIELENNIGRLRANITSSPKLSASSELVASMQEVDKAYPGDIALKQYYKAVDTFEKQRRSWRFMFSSTFGGFSTPQRLELSPVPGNLTK